MKVKLTTKEKQDILLEVLRNNSPEFAVFGIEKEVVTPLIKWGFIHRDTYKYTGGAKLTKLGRNTN